MRITLRYLLAALLGAALGVAFAVHTVRAGAFASTVQIGPWRTGRDFGTTDAPAKTRAVVALTGLLALPAKEARYYTATTDDVGQPLDGRCTYLVEGGALPGQWWSLTLYDGAGYLAGRGPFSIESAEVTRLRNGPGQPLAKTGRWVVVVTPSVSRPLSLPTAGLPSFQLTLRLYLPNDGGRSDPPRAVLPTVTKEGC